MSCTNSQFRIEFDMDATYCKSLIRILSLSALHYKLSVKPMNHYVFSTTYSVCRLDCLLLHTGLPYNQRHSVDMAMYPSQGSSSGSGSIGGGQNFCTVNGDSSQQDSGNTTPLAFDYETRSHIKLLLLLLQLLFILQSCGRNISISK